MTTAAEYTANAEFALARADASARIHDAEYWLTRAQVYATLALAAGNQLSTCNEGPR